MAESGAIGNEEPQDPWSLPFRPDHSGNPYPIPTVPGQCRFRLKTREFPWFSRLVPCPEPQKHRPRGRRGLLLLDLKLAPGSPRRKHHHDLTALEPWLLLDLCHLAHVIAHTVEQLIAEFLMRIFAAAEA